MLHITGVRNSDVSCAHTYKVALFWNDVYTTSSSIGPFIAAFDIRNNGDLHVFKLHLERWGVPLHHTPTLKMTQSKNKANTRCTQVSYTGVKLGSNAKQNIRPLWTICGRSIIVLRVSSDTFHEIKLVYHERKSFYKYDWCRFFMLFLTNSISPI